MVHFSRFAFLPFTAAITALAGCNVSEAPYVAEKAVPRFHEQFNSREFSRMYRDAADDLKETSSEENFVSSLSTVRTKLGAIKSSERRGWHVKSSISGTLVVIAYRTRHTGGDADEQITYRVAGKSAKLVAFHVRSDLLRER